MGSKLINTTLSALSAGVSQQYEEGRYDSQVEEMINCMPSLTRGILRRNPLEGAALLQGIPTDISDAFTYSYDRGNANEQYMIVVPGDGSIFVYNVNEPTGTPIYTTTGSAYLTTTNRARDIFKAITIGDHTFILNKEIIVDFTGDLASSDGYEDMLFYWIKKTTSVVTNQLQNTEGKVGMKSIGYTYTSNEIKIIGHSETRPGEVEILLNTADKIAEQFSLHYNGGATPTSGVNQVAGSIVYNKANVLTDYKWGDTFGDEASLGVWKVVGDATELPANLPKDLDGFLVKVTQNTSGEFDDYYLKYTYDDKIWKEVVKPGEKYRLDPTTMPHVMYSFSPTHFEFSEYRKVNDNNDGLETKSLWIDRASGGGGELDDPSFIGTNINSLFFHKNRLGILTRDSVILSQSGDYGNFFAQTVQEVLPDDPIDLSVASTDVTILRAAVSTAGQLLLFSDDTQFSLSSNIDGALTPQTADITPLSNYTYGPRAEAASIGNRIYFTNQAGGYSQVYSYQVTDQGSRLTEGNQMTIHLPSYIDKSTSSIVGHDVLGYIFIQQEDIPKELIVLTSISKNREDLQNAFHKWQFSKDILSTHIINNDLYVLFTDGSLTKMKLEVPGDIDTVNYLDTYNSTDKLNNYSSKFIFSQFYYRNANGKGTVRGRFQLRTLEYTIVPESRYKTVIFNTDYQKLVPINIFGPLWVDTAVWNDTLLWYDVLPNYSREYDNDSKVTVMGDSKKIKITFESSHTEYNKGFELATVNIEGLFHQRSSRVN